MNLDEDYHDLESEKRYFFMESERLKDKIKKLTDILKTVDHEKEIKRIVREIKSISATTTILATKMSFFLQQYSDGFYGGKIAEFGNKQLGFDENGRVINTVVYKD